MSRADAQPEAAERPADDRFCAHCGLPLGAARCSPDGRTPFCCYGCYLVYRIVGGQEEQGVAAGILARLGVGAFLAMNVMMVSLLLYTDPVADIGEQARLIFRWVLLGLSTPVLILLGLPFVAGALGEIQRRTVSTNGLVTLGVFSAFGVSAANVIRGDGHIYFDTATMLLVLLTLGRLLEATAKSRTARVVRGLLELAAPKARVLTADGEDEVRPEDVTPGQRVRVKPGEKIPVDGRVIAGVTTVEEAAFTGESVPRTCRSGDRVFGGSLSADGEIIVEAEGVGEGSLLAQMVRLVREAQNRRAPVERLVDRVARVFASLVLLVALGALAYWHFARSDAERGAMSALAVLVVACPCALGLATPLATALGVSRAACAGILIRSGEVLERLRDVSRVFLDKTGTLTRGTMALTDLARVGHACVSRDEALSWLASLESASEHPIGRAIVAAAAEANVPLGTVADFRARAGEGAAGTVTLNGATRQVVAGTADFVADMGLRGSDGALGGRPAGTTQVYAGWDGQVQAIASLSDRLRPEASEAVADLLRMGMTVSVVSGDRGPVVAQLAERLGLEDVRGDCTPDLKIAAIRDARGLLGGGARVPACGGGGMVAMVGDGINDAPALAEADVGIAMSSGTQLAQEASDVTLLGDDLRRLPWLFGLAQRTYRTIRQNLVWAFGYNLVMLSLAFFGLLHPLLAALLMLASSFFVLGNSLRLAQHP